MDKLETFKETLITIRVSNDDKELLTKTAKENKTSVSRLVRRLIENHLNGKVK